MTYIFKRKEKKYMLTEAQYKEFVERIKDHMKDSEFAPSTVCSLYYDTDDFELINKSIEKPVYKEKFRLRCYDVPNEDSRIFAEIKKKYDGTVYKRRIAASYKEMKAFLEEGKELPTDKQIQNEIKWMVERYGLKPAFYLACDRTALVGKEDKGLRITFDSNIRYRTEDLDLIYGDAGKKFFEDNIYIMEIKFEGACPLWLARTLSEMKIYPHSFSKYGNAYIQKNFKGATQC